MSALLMIVGVLAYIACGVYVCLRLLWEFREREMYEPGTSSILASLLLPIGLAFLIAWAVQRRFEVITTGLPPRAERQKYRIQRLEARNRKLERQLDLSGWDFDQINADADELRQVRATDGVGAMLAHAIGVPAEAWRGNGGVDRPAGH
jgi:hypothetical protein